MINLPVLRESSKRGKTRKTSGFGVVPLSASECFEAIQGLVLPVVDPG